MFSQADSITPFAIFLDIDGVIYNSPNQNAVFKKVAELFPNEKECYSNKIYSIAASYFFDKVALQNLDHLINEIEKSMQVWIVISSSWRENRTVEELKTTIFGIHNFSKYIVDKTPEEIPENEISSYCSKESHLKKYSSQCRASEIQYWLKQHPEVINFVVLDDRDNHLSENFREKFVQTEYKTLLTEEISKKILMNV